MILFIGFIVMVIGAAGLWRYEGNFVLTLVSMLIYGIGSYYVSGWVFETLGGV